MPTTTLEKTTTVEDREAHVSAIESLRAQLKDALPGLADAEAKALGGVRKAEAALETARSKWRAATTARTGFATRLEGETAQLEGQLRASADSRIGAFIRELGADEERLRHEAPGSQLVSKFDANEGRDRSFFVSDYGSINARLGAIRAARERAEALLLEPLGEDEVGAALAELRRSIGTAGAVDGSDS